MPRGEVLGNLEMTIASVAEWRPRPADARAGSRVLVEAGGILITCLPNPETVAAVYGEVDKPGLLPAIAR